MDFDPALPWRRSPSVALRPERFGALAYDFGTRRLSFLKSPQLVRVVEGLSAAPSADAALDAAGVTAADRPTYVRALAGLADSGMITARPAA